MKLVVSLLLAISISLIIHGKHGYEQEIKTLKAEIWKLKKENDLLKRELSNLRKPQTRKVWKQVRPPIQIEGSIDDGYELVEEPIK